MIQRSKGEKICYQGITARALCWAGHRARLSAHQLGQDDFSAAVSGGTGPQGRTPIFLSPRLVLSSIPLPWQLAGADAWRQSSIREVSLSEAPVESRGVFRSHPLEVTGAASLLCIMSVYFIARKGGNKYHQTSPAFPPPRSTQENPSIPTKQAEPYAKPNRAHTDIVIFWNDTFNLIIWD